MLRAALSDRVADAERRLPCRCKFNHRHPLDERRNVDGETNPDYNRIAPAAETRRTIGLCMYGADDPTTWPGTICEDEADAVQCPWFTPHKTRDEVVSEFQESIRDPGWLDSNLPLVHVLRWVLDDTRVPEVQQEPPPEPPKEIVVAPPDLTPPDMSWWQRLLWRWFFYPPGRP